MQVYTTTIMIQKNNIVGLSYFVFQLMNGKTLTANQNHFQLKGLSNVNQA